MNNRSELIDQIKGISIVAVVLFHLGLFRYGYLGVDVFYAVAGFLTARCMAAKFDAGTFSYREFIMSRVRRVMPLVLMGGIVTLALGVVLMMPDDLDHAARSVVASNLFLNNILCYHSNSDYWATKNEYAPMLHFWYLGVLFQLYCIYPFVVWLGRKICKRQDWGVVALILVLSIASAIGWFVTPVPLHFYNMPFRFFEFGTGTLFYYFGLQVPSWHLPLPGLALAGRSSLSIYVWHYIPLAFVRYALAPQIDARFVAAYVAVLVAIAFVSYRFVEIRKFKPWVLISLFVVLTGISTIVYLRAGILYDIPELDVEVSKARRGVHLAYCDRIYAYDKDFPENGKVNVLVMGNSWARDWANVLLESSVSNRMNLSYVYSEGRTGHEALLVRIKKADVVFVRGPDTPSPVATKRFVYHIGYKWFGPSNGYAFARRFRDDYKETSIRVPDEIKHQNESDRAVVGEEWFVDLINALRDENGCIPVFSDDGKMISHDCYHLTHGGAIFLAKRLTPLIEKAVRRVGYLE